MTARKATGTNGATRRVRAMLPLGVCLLTAACGGGGSGGGVATTPAPVPAPAISPAAPPPSAPTSVPASAVYTAEYYDSDGPGYHGADTAYLRGVTGAGITAAIIDSGLDPTSHEFAGRIHPQSADLAGIRGMGDEDGHGTAVARVLAAARDNRDILGMAHGATLLALRTDAPGTCTGASTADGCTFSTDAIAAGIDRAITANARVINVSLGGESAGSRISDAVRRAAGAGVVIVVAAGNAGGSSTPAAAPADPNGFATAILAAGGGNVIVVGSIDGTGQISSFSNRAGAAQRSVLVALGRGICCVYENDSIKTEPGGVRYGYGGTSFSTPQVSGAVALLAEAFPNLSGAAIVELLLSTARDAGDAGTDAIYGRGILDIDAAFQPQGSLTAAGTALTLTQTQALGTVSAAMGDAGTVGTRDASLVMLDRYARAYSIDVSRTLTRSTRPGRLAAPLLRDEHETASSLAGMIMRHALHPAAAARFVEARPTDPGRDRTATLRSSRIAGALSAHTALAWGYHTGSDTLTDDLAGGASGAAFLAAEGAGVGRGFGMEPAMALALQRRLGSFRVTLAAEQGKIASGWRSADLRDLVRATGSKALYRSLSASVAGLAGTADWTVRLNRIDETRSVAGARFTPGIGGNGAASLFIDGGAGWQLSPRWRVAGGVTLGWTTPRTGGLVAPGGRLSSSAWQIDISRAGTLSRDDRLALRVTQPLRIDSGGLALNLPVAYDHASATADFAIRPLALVPTGRELTAELAYALPIAPGTIDGNLFWRRQPGHIAAAPDDLGIAIRFRSAF